jgi:hypothetical protein
MKYIKKYDQQRYDAFSQWAKNFVKTVQVENRLDAGETAQFTRALTYSIKQGFKKQYPALKARRFLPMSNDIPQGVTTVNPWIVQGFGQALLGTPVNNKIPEVSVQRSEVPNPVMPATAKWVVTKEQLKQAAYGEFDLNSAGIDTTIETIEKGIDDLLSAGNSDRGLEDHKLARYTRSRHVPASPFAVQIPRIAHHKHQDDNRRVSPFKNLAHNNRQMASFGELFIRPADYVQKRHENHPWIR